MLKLSGNRLIRDELEGVRKLSKRLTIVFWAVFAVACACCLAGVCVSVYSIASDESGTPLLASMISSVPVILYYCTVAFIFWIIASIFHAISRGGSPFTHTQARRIRTVSFLFIAIALIELLISTGCIEPASVDGFVKFGYANPAPEGPATNLFIDAKSIVGAVIGFCLSVVFDYGTTLQELADDTC